MSFEGIVLGASVFLIIGIFHPIVIKMEYYWGKRSWWVLLLGGIIFCILSLFTTNQTLSAIWGATAFSCFWSIHELFEQEQRVLKGWFPMNPKRKDYYHAKSFPIGKKKSPIG